MKEMKQNYESPDMEVIELDSRDFIVASDGDTDVSPGGEDGWLAG